MQIQNFSVKDRFQGGGTFAGLATIQRSLIGPTGHWLKDLMVLVSNCPFSAF
jgi:hypothetical protein